MALPSVVETMFNVGAYLQTFPYPTIRRSFLYSNVLMAKWRSQTLANGEQVLASVSKWSELACLQPCVQATES